MTYVAKSIGGIANLFEERRMAAMKAADRAKTKQTKAERLSEARTWRAAIEILRYVKLEPGP